ncbi:MAG: threonine ammonia-lyase IlvA [Candidatus Roizmanbacteria bacterium]
MNISIQEINKASELLKGIVHKTPLQYSKRLSKKYNADIYIKREDLQEVRSFKIRGAYNKIASLTDEEKKRGVVTASAGNHAQGVAYACSALKIKGVIFMPATTPRQKVEKVQYFGDTFVEIQLTGDTFDASKITAETYCKEHNAIFVHPFNDPLVIAGQGTVAHEFYNDLDGKVDVVVVPIGGGGLISGVASYIKQSNSKIKVIGAEPDGAAEMLEARKAGKVVTLDKIDTFADGVAVKTAGDLTFLLCEKYVDDIISVPEGKICTEMIELYQKDGIIAEPAGAVSITALDSIKHEIKGKTVVCILSGGNNDISRYAEIIERSLLYKGLKHYFIVEFAQKPGQLRAFLHDCLGPDDDITLFEYYKRNNKEKGPALVGIELKYKDDLYPLLERLEKIGINIRKITPDDLSYHLLVS